MSGLEQHYRTLGLTSAATRDQVKQAYRKLCVQHHPDLAAGPARRVCDLRIKEINAAYNSILKGPVDYHGKAHRASNAGSTNWAKKPRGFSPLIIGALIAVPIIAGGVRFALFYRNLEQYTGRRDGLLNPPVNEFLKDTPTTK